MSRSWNAPHCSTARSDANGYLALASAFDRGRSRLTTLRFDGLARASRPLPGAGDAVRVITSALGPGLLAGDRVMRDLDVGAQSTLVVGGQMATPIYAGSASSRSDTSSRIGASATLYAPGEPLILAPGAEHESNVEVDLAFDGFALFAEIVVLGERARLRSRMSARIDGRLAVRDACDLEGDGSDGALLTAIAVTADATRRASVASTFQRALACDPSVHGGVGETAGASILRARASGAWALQRLLECVIVSSTAARASPP